MSYITDRLAHDAAHGDCDATDALAEIARLEAREDGYKAHIAKQAAEIADLHKLLQDGWVEVADGPVSRRALKERDAARAEADSLRQDAERYRHWRNLSGPIPSCFRRLCGDELDAAIDDAMAKGREK